MSGNGYVDAIVGTEVFVEAVQRVHPSVSTVLITDDQPVMHVILGKMLKSLGIATVLRADSASDAFRVLHESRVDLMMCDVAMKPTSGLKLLQAIRRTPDLGRLPVIMMSATMDARVVAEVVRAKADTFMLKPFDAILLRTKINEIVSERNR